MNKETKNSMETQEILTLRKAMEKALEGKRYEHTLGVAYTAASLAMCYGQDVHKAQVAGLLHDCAKNYTNEKRINICRKNGIPMKPNRKTRFFSMPRLAASSPGRNMGSRTRKSWMLSPIIQQDVRIWACWIKSFILQTI